MSLLLIYYRYKIYWLIVTLISLIILPLQPSYAQDRLVVQFESSEPWAYYSESPLLNGNNFIEIKGIWVSFLKEISKITGYEFEISIAPFARVVRNLEKGRIDLSFLPLQTTFNYSRRKLVYLYSYNTVVTPRKGISIKTYDDLHYLRIGAVHGIKYSERFDNDSSLLKNYFRSQDILLSMMNKNRMDAIVGNQISIDYLIRKYKLDNMIGDQYILAKIPIWAQFSSSSHQGDKLQNFRIAVEALHQKKVLQNLIISHQN